MHQIHPHALFRLSVLGPLASRDRLEQGELKAILRELASQSYAIPNSKKVFLGEKTIEAWYYAWKRGGIDALTPKVRSDSGSSKMSIGLQKTILDAKKEQPRRSARAILEMLTASGVICDHSVSRSSIHRLLQQNGISARVKSHLTEEQRTYLAARSNDIWYFDVMPGPKVLVDGLLRKVYLVSFISGKLRRNTFCAYCSAVTSRKIEEILKQALLKCRIPARLQIDNHLVFQSKNIKRICSRVEIQLFYCRPYVPEIKVKQDSWHRTLRSSFLGTINIENIGDIHDLNKQLWTWLESRSIGN